MREVTGSFDLQSLLRVVYYVVLVFTSQNYETESKFTQTAGESECKLVNLLLYRCNKVICMMYIFSDWLMQFPFCQSPVRDTLAELLWHISPFYPKFCPRNRVYFLLKYLLFSGKRILKWNNRTHKKK